MAYEIDLFSDTLTQPSAEMRRCMAAAVVGDEQLREDPSVLQLEDEVCRILDKEAAVFLPTGTMCNLIAVRVSCQPGDEAIVDCSSHCLHFESGGSAAVSGVGLFPLQGIRGVFTAEQVEEAVRPASNHFPRSRLIIVEQTANLGGGTVWELGRLREIRAAADRHQLLLHMDGARLFNAATASGVDPADYARLSDSIWIDFSKGLGAPVGAALAGSKKFIEQARRFKHQFGGAMRQAGIVAAGALYALQNNIARLKDDHENAACLADGLRRLPGIEVEPVETNIVYFSSSAPQQLAQALAERSLRVSQIGNRLRAVTHLNVTRQQILQTIEIVESVTAA